ncbi:metallo-beta-lactamase family protein [Pyrenochaeta sp. MPI-SDFR-AT-0127]|nr:metallo-beta-lactamase family protein [Pyrenochaeta sp. MPI-SDFR-AT-0127]
MKSSHLFALSAFSAAICASKLRVETFINDGPSLNMVSSLIIGSNASILIDMPLAIPQAQALAAWVSSTTDTPLIAVFTTHFHPDHYLSGAALLSHFPSTKYFANSGAVAHIQNEAAEQVRAWGGILGAGSVSEEPVLPMPYDFTFFTLPGDEDEPINLLSPLVGDTVDETLFWIPSIETLVAGDAVYAKDMHLWLADLATPALTDAWLSTLDFIEYLQPRRIIPGHAVSTKSFCNLEDLKHSRDYVTFFKERIQAEGADAFTSQEIFGMFDEKFPGILSQNSAVILNISSENFGRGGVEKEHYFDLKAFNSTEILEGWEFGI